MKYPLLPLLLLIAGCAQTGSNTSPAKDSTVVVAEKAPEETRSQIKTDPVAGYTEKVPDELNDWKFDASLYETRNTFQYLLRVRYKEIRVQDTVTVPNLGFMPKVDIRKGKEPLSCIIGFLDKKSDFKEYKLVRVKDDRLKISTINYYSVSHYTTKQP